MASDYKMNDDDMQNLCHSEEKVLLKNPSSHMVFIKCSFQRSFRYRRQTGFKQVSNRFQIQISNTFQQQLPGRFQIQIDVLQMMHGSYDRSSIALRQATFDQISSKGLLIRGFYTSVFEKKLIFASCCTNLTSNIHSGPSTVSIQHGFREHSVIRQRRYDRQVSKF